MLLVPIATAAVRAASAPPNVYSQRSSLAPYNNYYGHDKASFILHVEVQQWVQKLLPCSVSLLKLCSHGNDTVTSN